MVLDWIGHSTLGGMAIPWYHTCDGTTREAPLDGSVTVSGSFMEPRKLMLSPPWLMIVAQACCGHGVVWGGREGGGEKREKKEKKTRAEEVELKFCKKQRSLGAEEEPQKLPSFLY